MSSVSECQIKFFKESFEKYFQEVVKKEEEAMLKMANAYLETHKIYNQEEDKEYLENTRKLGRDKYGDSSQAQG